MKRIHHIVSYEDRPDAMWAALLMVESVLRFHPSWRFTLFIPNCPIAILNQLTNREQVTVISDSVSDFSGWDVKPAVLLELLKQCPDARITWLDSDLVARGPIDRLLDQEDPVLAAAAEWHYRPPNDLWTVQWKMPVGRSVPSFNSCVVSVTNAHVTLLNDWMIHLRDPRYREAQQLPFSKRGLAFRGDQDVLNALIGSRQHQEVSFDLLENRRQVGHCAGLVAIGLKNRVHDKPPLLHAIGRKPWDKCIGFKGWLYSFEADVSPYVLEAKKLSEVLQLMLPWCDAKTVPGKVLRTICCNHPMLTGLVPGAVHQLKRKMID